MPKKAAALPASHIPSSKKDAISYHAYIFFLSFQINRFPLSSRGQDWIIHSCLNYSLVWPIMICSLELRKGPASNEAHSFSQPLHQHLLATVQLPNTACYTKAPPRAQSLTVNIPILPKALVLKLAWELLGEFCFLFFF